MKKRGLTLFGILIVLLSLSLVSAQTACDLSAKLVNQDPYPATPGEYVKLVFQLDGVSNANCGDVTLTLKEEFPFSLDPGVEYSLNVRSGTYTRDYASFFLAPFNIRVDEDALEGENLIEIEYTHSQGSENVGEIKKFNITIEDQRVDFEVAIKDYFPETKTIRFEILNIGESDIEALTIEIPKQENIIVKGSSRNIIGSLDSNDDTTFDFEASPEDGEINILISYTDETSTRRYLEKTIEYDSSYFTDRAREGSAPSTSFYLLMALILSIIIYWFWKRDKRKKRRHLEHHHK